MFKIGNDKHYRMTEESLKFIEMRDKQKYPKESLLLMQQYNTLEGGLNKKI